MFYKYFALFFAVLYLYSASLALGQKKPVPGDGGTQIEAKLNKSEVVHYFCEKSTTTYFTLWLNLEFLVPYVLDCFVDNMRLVYNATTHTTSDSPGVTTRISGWGKTTTIEWLDPSQDRIGIYFATIVENAVSWGYRRSKNIRGAPFDFRKAPSYNMDHWRIVLPPSKLRKEQRSMTSSAFLMPSDKFWSKNETLVITANRNYTVADYKQFFADINYKTGWLMYQDVGHLFYDLTAPGVEVHCLYGTGLPTPAKLVYKKGYFPDYQPTEIYEDGDGTVNLRSLEGCLRWKSEQKQPVYNQTFPSQEHLMILQDLNMISYIKNVLYSSQNN